MTAATALPSFFAPARHGDDGRRRKTVAALGVAVLHGLLGYLLVTGTGATIVRAAGEEMKTFDVVEVPPRPEPAPAPPMDRPKAAAKATKGAAAPADLRAAPPATVMPPAVPLVAVREDSLAAVGAADRTEPGTASGGSGTGTGSGTDGNGTGAGGDGIAVHANRIRGSIGGGDYPWEAYKAHAGGTTAVRLLIGTDGKVRSCTIVESSGRQDLDFATCYLIRKRFRYSPARDGHGRKVEETVHRAQVWETAPRP